MPFTLSSPAFRHEESIPPRHTAEGENISPALHITDVPSSAKSLVLIVEDPDAPDPDAPKRIFTHWILYNMPADTGALAEGVDPGDLPPGTKQGKTDFGKTGYGGPAPPIGRHRYFFKLYALDRELPDLGTPGKTELERAMQGHVIAQTELMGTYQKHG